MDTSPEDVALWLARETGHTAEGPEGYETKGAEMEEEGPRRIGLPQDNHEKLRRFFDGLNIEKAMTEKRRASAIDKMDETAQMNEALKQATPPGGGY